MSTPWIIAAGVLTLLVVVLATALVMVMTRVSELESALTRVQRQVRSLQQTRTGGTASAPPPPPPPAASVVVLLEAAREADLALADDIRRSGGVSVDVPTTVYVADDDNGRAIAEGLALEVSPFFREAPLSNAFPSVVVLDESGGVLASGSPATVADLESLVTRHRHVHSGALQ
ncbi:MAG: hypothetical protein WCA29_01500 [Jiangellales bacterium]